MTNLNVFSSMLSKEKMVKITSGGEKECGEEGDYLAWREARWTLHGEAAIEVMEMKGPCEEDSNLNLFYGKFFNMENCMQHCEKLGVRVPPVITQNTQLRCFLRSNYITILYNILYNYITLGTSGSGISGKGFCEFGKELGRK